MGRRSDGQKRKRKKKSVAIGVKTTRRTFSLFSMGKVTKRDLPENNSHK